MEDNVLVAVVNVSANAQTKKVTVDINDFIIEYTRPENRKYTHVQFFWVQDIYVYICIYINV